MAPLCLSKRSIFTLLLVSLATALDPIDHQAHGTYFISPHTPTHNQTYVFALNLIPSTGDIYFHMSASSSSWMGVGFGPRMQDTFMLLAHPSSNASGLTLSARVARHAHSEPSLLHHVRIDKIFSDAYAPAANTVHGGLMIAHAVCRNCSALIPSLNLSSPAQPFIFALGPEAHKLASDDPAAPLRRHAVYGHFEADLRYAVSEPEHARVPPPNDPGGSPSGVADTNFAWAFAARVGGVVRDSGGWAGTAHGVVMSLAFALVFPAGIVVKRVLGRLGFWVHVGVQGVGLLLVLVGLGAGVAVSREYNRSRGMGAAHQVVGLGLVVALGLQVGLGVGGHWVWRRAGRSSWLGVAHRVWGTGVVVVGLVNGGLGLDFAGECCDFGETSVWEVADSVQVTVAIMSLMALSWELSARWCWVSWFCRSSGGDRRLTNRSWSGPAEEGQQMRTVGVFWLLIRLSRLMR